MEQKRELRHGDRVSALGLTCTIDSILYQDHFGDRPPCPGSDMWGYDIEFNDTKGNYHHWKQNRDGGAAFRWDGRAWLPIVSAVCPCILRRYRNDMGCTAWIEWTQDVLHTTVTLKIFNQEDYKIWESVYQGTGAEDRARIDLITRAAGIWTEEN